MTGYNNIIEGLIDHVSLLQELGERSVEMDSALLKALETDNAAAQTAAPAVARRRELQVRAQTDSLRGAERPFWSLHPPSPASAPASRPAKPARCTGAGH